MISSIFSGPFGAIVAIAGLMLFGYIVKRFVDRKFPEKKDGNNK